MARPSARVTLPQQNHSGPRIPALHPAAPPDSSFSTPLGVNRSAGARIADSATGNTNNEFTGKYEDFMRLMKAANHEVMYREVSSTHAGSEVAVGGGQGEKQNLGFLRLPIKRRHSEAEQTQSFPPPSLCQPRTPTLPQVITELENATSSPSPVTAHSFEEMQALQSLQVMGSSRPQSIVCQPIPSIEQVVPTSITVATTTAPETATNSIPNTKKNARDRLFDALVAANLRVSGWTVDARGIPVPPVDNILWRRTISGPDDLERAESVRLFEILEACSHATQPDAPMTMTRGNIDRFFDAIFKNWDPESWDAEAARTIRPDFAASAETIAGKVCGVYISRYLDPLIHRAVGLQVDSYSFSRREDIFHQLSLWFLFLYC